MIKLILVGCGNMGYAMLAGWVNSGKLTPADVVVVEPVEALRDRAGRLGVKAVASADEVPAGAGPQLVVFAVKPQAMGRVVPEYRYMAAAGATFLSVATRPGHISVARIPVPTNSRRRFWLNRGVAVCSALYHYP